MRRSILLLTLVGAMLLACTGVVLAQSTSPSGGQQSPSGQAKIPPGKAKKVCPEPATTDSVRCHLQVRTDLAAGPTATDDNGTTLGGTADATAPGQDSKTGKTTGGAGKAKADKTNTAGAVTPSALKTGSVGPWNACDLQAAYNLPATYISSQSVTESYCPSPPSGSTTLNPGSGPTVAIVDAYDDPKAESDLGVYRSYYGLGSCTTANKCFKKVNQSGGTRYPKANSGWAQEISLDIQMVSAICPNCRILLVEANSNQWSDLITAVDWAIKPTTQGGGGADYVSLSWGGSEFSSQTSSSYDGHFNKTGKAITASSGDNGYGVSYPASSQYVTAVGGTSLTRDGTSDTNNRTSNDSSNPNWHEKVWSGAGSGCSAYEPKPGGQTSWQSGSPWEGSACAMRTIADVAAIADPNTGVWVYDSYQTGGSHWFAFGGTSVASPIIASVYALAGNAPSVTYGSYPYLHLNTTPTDGTAPTRTLWDVGDNTGNNGTCSINYLCTGMANYDGPTGLGTPNGINSF